MEEVKQVKQAASGNALSAFFRCLRPKQWTKNVLVFGAFLFSVTEVGVSAFVNSLFGFLLFCCVAGVVYIINDYMDVEQDRVHPEKRFRPMASGAIRPNTALTLGIVLLIAALSLSLMLNVPFTILLVAYFIMNIAYSVRLKHVVIIDVMIVAAGFVMRAVGGAMVIERPFTPWFLVCTMLLALFLAISKRRHELILFQEKKGSHRKVLQFYSPQLLDQMISIVTTATIMSYGLYTFTSGVTVHLMWTLPFVIYGIFRYLYLIYMEEKGGSPEKVLLQDKHILTTVLLYGVTVFIILYFYGG
ncbi:decaprenyl-phosphate phosphoribosyltransferase [Paenibacillus turpanensis]|uniref:decaprenyl-phosphate phosphoribosyltransferase n=1 Tax=Paenibacillus turpanensis TaxID=2689078 RepID=UPI00140C626F|nr:decaprenyl-phosphate phosphoribosyltransferase [Paenibacillus turpanensis]